MQYATLLLIVFLTGVAAQDWNLGKFEPAGDDSLGFGRYITNKRAINGQLRRSSIRWGKRTNEDDVPELIPLPEDFMVMWPANDLAPAATNPEVKSSEQKNKNKAETTTATPENPSQSTPENSIMERVAKGGIRPKLALSSRLWGR